MCGGAKRERARVHENASPPPPTRENAYGAYGPEGEEGDSEIEFHALKHESRILGY